MNLFHHVSNMYAILFIRLRSVLFVTLVHWFFKHLWNSTIFLSVALCSNLVHDHSFYLFYPEDGVIMFPQHVHTHVKKLHGSQFQKIIFMLMAVRHSVWSVFFCSDILPTSQDMFRYLALYFRLSLLYPCVWFSSLIFRSTHIPWFYSFTQLDTACPIPFLYPHPYFCSVVFASMHGFVVSCSVR